MVAEGSSKLVMILVLIGWLNSILGVMALLNFITRRASPFLCSSFVGLCIIGAVLEVEIILKVPSSG
jgi:hypothetical protein